MVQVLGARKTVDQRECKKYWFHNGKLVTGCSIKIDPDGKEGNEWCYVENPKPDDATWAICVPMLDFDQVR